MIVNVGLILAVIAINSCIRLMDAPSGKSEAHSARQLFAVCGILATLFFSYNLIKTGNEVSAQVDKAQESVQLQQRIDALLNTSTP